MASINSLNSHLVANSTLNSRVQPAKPEPIVDAPQKVLRAGFRYSKQPSPETSLSSQPKELAATAQQEIAQTYTHLSKTLSPEELELDDFRSSLNRLQDLAGITKSYKGSMRSLRRAGASVLSEPQSAPRGRQDNYDSAGKRYTPADSGKLFSLTVTTADGDTIQLAVNKTYNPEGEMGSESYTDTETSISFEVFGDLDEKELQALAKLSDKIGSLTDSYRKDGWTSLGGLDSFDESELSSFSLNVLGVGSDSFDVQYSAGGLSGQRSLSANQNGYRYDIQADIDGFKLDEDIGNNAQYQQYRQLILSTALSYKAGEDAGGVNRQATAGFFLDGMAALFHAPETSKEALEPDEAASRESPEGSSLEGRAPGGEATEASGQATSSDELHPLINSRFGSENGLLDRFSSGLPDFTAFFSTPVFRPNGENPGEVSVMELNLSQSTRITETRDALHSYSQVSQHSEYSSRVSQHMGIAGDSVEHANLAAKEDGGQSYLYRTDKKSGGITRSLNFQDNASFVSVDEIRTQQHIRTDKLVIGGYIQDKTTEDLSDPEKNTANRLLVANTRGEKDLARQRLEDYRTIEQLDNFIEANKVELFT